MAVAPPSEGDLDPASVVVVGAGPAGIIAALELSRQGIDVLLVESGGRRRNGRAQRLGDLHARGPGHVAMSRATFRGLGGTSNVWGGRCVPLDPIDFESRPGLRE